MSNLEEVLTEKVETEEIECKEVIITAEEARKMIKEYEERIEALRMKTLEDFNSKIKIF
jgi:hypothetical protein